jgi:uncharacterized protein
MRRRTGRIIAITAVALLLVLVLGRSVAVFYTDLLWYDAVGQSAVFWKRLLAAAVVRLVLGAVGAAVILLNLWYVLRQLGPVHLRRRYGNLEIAEQVPRSYLVAGAVLVAVLAGWWLVTLQFGGAAPIAALAWLQRENWGVADPLFGHDVSFYVFGLPLYTRLLEYLLIILIWSILLVGVGYVLIGAVRMRASRVDLDERPRMHFAALLAAAFVIFGVRYLLARYQLMLEGNGFGGAIGYTDVHARLPAHLVLAILSFITAAALIYGARQRSLVAPAVALAVLVLGAIAMGALYPAVLQKIRVEPNELAREARFIRWNMEFTRRAYGLDQVERRAFPYRHATAGDWVGMAPVLEDLSLWDPAPLQTAFNEVQARREYYHFPDVDFDRYGAEGSRQQVAVAVREFRREGLPPTARTWTNIHLNPLFTRGMGAVAVPAAQARPGDPAYWLRDVFPVQRSPDAPAALDLREPSIYFGETMTTYAVVGHTGSFAGTDPGDGQLPPASRVETGIELSSFLRVLSFAWRFGDQNLLFARELSDTSRLIFRRRVGERLGTLAPFLLWDPDPHPVIMDGRVLWIADGYSASAGYPLSRAFTIEDMGTLRYMRSSVKATVDAVTGDVRMYALPDPDPMLRTYRRVFPGLIRDWEQMPGAIREHLRYPALLFRVQSNVLEQYHLEQPEAFYAGQDVWQLPQDVSPQVQRRFRPDFVMGRVPGSERSEFLLLNAFIARGRQNMTALLMARSDAPHYGQLVLLQMPLDDQIRGPSQVQSIIEQDPFISQQLSLWRQEGSNVELGRLRYLPTDRSILYVEPLFLSARERGIPQLQRVIVSDGVSVSMAPDIRSAIAGLVGDAAAADARDDEPGDEPRIEPGRPGEPGEEWRRRAAELMREAENRLRAGDFAGFGAAWNRLRALLEQGGGGAPQP